MLDDEKVTEQASPEALAEAEDAFAEDIPEEEKATPEVSVKEGQEKDPEKKTTTKAKAKEAEKTEETKVEETKKEEEGEKDLTAKDRLDERLKTVEEETPKVEDKKVEPEKKATEEPKKDALKVLTREDVVESLNLFSDVELPDEMVIGNTTVKLKEYAELYPDEFAVIKVTANAIAKKVLEKALQGVKADDVDSKFLDVESRIAQLSFDTQVAQTRDDEGNLKHPDYFDITRGSRMKEFHEWVKTQTPKVQKLASSMDWKDGVLILDYYKEATAKNKVGEFDEKARKKKKEIDSIHSTTTRSDKSISGKSKATEMDTNSPQDEAEAAFLEG